LILVPVDKYERLGTKDSQITSSGGAKVGARIEIIISKIIIYGLRTFLRTLFSILLMSYYLLHSIESTSPENLKTTHINIYIESFAKR